MKNETGREGEDFAVAYLRRKRYKVIARNYQTPIGEIDVVARDGDTLVFIEVKTRRTRTYGHPFEAVTRSKRERLRRLALYYLKHHERAEVPVRVDVIGLYVHEKSYQVHLIVDAFEV